MLICKFCREEKKNGNSLRNHERLCKDNPNKQLTYFQTNKEELKLSKNNSNSQNQYTKARFLGLPDPEISQETRNKLSSAMKMRTREFIDQNNKKVSIAVNKLVEEGKWHTSLAKNMHIEYNGVDLHGKWELYYAQWLDKNNIKWIRNKKQFDYIFDDKKRKYTPDFYLMDSNEYIEIKGYKTAKDIAKWECFPENETLIILTEKELKNLKII